MTNKTFRKFEEIKIESKYCDSEVDLDSATDAQKVAVSLDDQNNFFDNCGYITEIEAGIVRVSGLKNVQLGELVTIYPSKEEAMVLALYPNSVSIVICGKEDLICLNDLVVSYGDLISINISKRILGSIITPLGVNLVSDTKSRYSL